MTSRDNEDDYIPLTTMRPWPKAKKVQVKQNKTLKLCVLTLDLWLVEFIQEECRCKINDPTLKDRLQQNGHCEHWAGDPGPEIVSSGAVRGCLVILSRAGAYWLHRGDLRERHVSVSTYQEEALAN